MSELIRKGIDEANKDLVLENQHKLQQEVSTLPISSVYAVSFTNAVLYCMFILRVIHVSIIPSLTYFHVSNHSFPDILPCF